MAEYFRTVAGDARLDPGHREVPVVMFDRLALAVSGRAAVKSKLYLMA